MLFRCLCVRERETRGGEGVCRAVHPICAHPCDSYYKGFAGQPHAYCIIPPGAFPGIGDCFNEIAALIVNGTVPPGTILPGDGVYDPVTLLRTTSMLPSGGFVIPMCDSRVLCIAKKWVAPW